jgi:hypothetical protein
MSKRKKPANSGFCIKFAKAMNASMVVCMLSKSIPAKKLIPESEREGERGEKNIKNHL